MKIIVRYVFCLILAVMCGIKASLAQGFNSDRVELSNFITRMYESSPFEGVRVVTDYDNSYLLSVLSLDKGKYANQSAMDRVAGVKAMSQASQYFNGSSISSDIIIKTVTQENTDSIIETEIIENIRENSIGYVKSLEMLTTFEGKDKRQVFIYFMQIQMDNSKEEKTISETKHKKHKK